MRFIDKIHVWCYRASGKQGLNKLARQRRREYNKELHRVVCDNVDLIVPEHMLAPAVMYNYGTGLKRTIKPEYKALAEELVLAAVKRLKNIGESVTTAAKQYNDYRLVALRIGVRRFEEQDKQRKRQQEIQEAVQVAIKDMITKGEIQVCGKT